jgi:C-terminal processing protease CtpA/Prc
MSGDATSDGNGFLSEVEMGRASSRHERGMLSTARALLTDDARDVRAVVDALEILGARRGPLPARAGGVRSPVAIVSLLLSSLVACTSETSSSNEATNTSGPPPSAACAEGATRCEGDLVGTCTNGAFGASVACEGESVCRDGGCRAPTEAQLAQATELASMITYVEETSAYPYPLDWGKLRADGRKSILGGDGSDLAYTGALFRAFAAVPQRHQTFYLEKGCGSLIPYASFSTRGACGQPHSRGIVVTAVKPTNPLGLKKGDLVTRVANTSGAGVRELLSARPMCGASFPSTSNRDAVVATTFTDLLVAGEEIEIESPDGTKRTVTVPDAPLGTIANGLSCTDPFARAHVPVESELRADGIGIIRLPGFTDPEQNFPSNPTQEALDAYRAKFEAKIQAAFDKVKSAPAIVWDIRGNGGGLTLVALGIASGFLGARAEPLSYCEARVPKTSPPQFDTFRYAEYALTPGGSFAYSGKVAVLIDGLDYSAADYFPLAVKTRTNAKLFGAPAAGAFGATSETKSFDGPPAFSVSVDVNRCSSAEDGQPLEGKGTTPHVAVEYDPKDLASGKDTVLESAAASLK